MVRRNSVQREAPFVVRGEMPQAILNQSRFVGHSQPQVANRLTALVHQASGDRQFAYHHKVDSPRLSRQHHSLVISPNVLVVLPILLLRLAVGNDHSSVPVEIPFDVTILPSGKASRLHQQRRIAGRLRRNPAS